MDTKAVLAFLKNIRPLRSAHFILMVFFGLFFSNQFNLLKFILSATCIFSAWQFDVAINDYYDIEIDKISNKDRPLSQGTLNKKSTIIIGFLFLIISITFSILLSIFSLIFNSLFLLVGYTYSAPPIRFKKYIFGNIFVGLSSFLSYFIGLFSQIVFINMQQIIIGFLILSALSLGTVIKDYKDYEGDSKANINTIFTKYGLKKGRIIASVFLAITFFLPFILIHSLIDFIVILPITVIVIFLFNLKKIEKKVQVTFIFYLIEIFYVFLRFIGIINI
ncbi:MAG: hypothetical protein GF329_20810 [Candidatus Lokiarchaeota archaeon]|nr:hypothetical protein [Candidatus Lokiarchaeota archaeon]